MLLKKLYIKTIYKQAIRIKIINFLKSQKPLSAELEEVLDFLRHNQCHTYPYEFVKKYSTRNIEIFTDESCGLKYAIYHGKRLYFKRTWSNNKIKRCFKNISLEQDPQSPHCYLTPEFDVKSSDRVMDIGCAEGNFSLSIIDKVSHITLFEVDELWIEAIKMTFKPWIERGKVTIINRFVSNVTDEQNITIDDYTVENKISFIKADVEGAEEIVLGGAPNFLHSSQPIKIAITTYHKPHHGQTIFNILTEAGLSCQYSKGYMILKNQGNLKPPYLRRGLIYAERI